MDLWVLFGWLIWIVVIVKLISRFQRRFEYTVLKILVDAEGTVYPKYVGCVLLETYHQQRNQVFVVKLLRDFVSRGWATSEEFIAGDCRVEGFALTEEGRRAFARRRE